jgi:hypothetical protein
MNNFIESKRIIESFSVVVVLTTILAVGVFADEDKSNVSAQVVDIDEPPTNATEELDVKVDPTEPLPVNGTIIVDITNADDVDLNALPPEGVSIVVTNSTLTVTNHPVEISEGASGTPPTDAEGFSTGPTISNNEDEVEGSSDDDEASGGGGGGDDEGDESTNASDSPDDEDEEEE